MSCVITLVLHSRGDPKVVSSYQLILHIALTFT